MFETDRFGCDHMHKWPALQTWEDGRVDLFGDVLIVRHDHSAAGTCKCFVCGSGHHVSIRERAWVFTGAD